MTVKGTAINQRQSLNNLLQPHSCGVGAYTAPDVAARIPLSLQYFLDKSGGNTINIDISQYQKNCCSPFIANRLTNNIFKFYVKSNRNSGTGKSISLPLPQ